VSRVPDSVKQEIVRRVMARLSAPVVGAGIPHDVDSLPAELRGSSEGRWEDATDPGIGVTSPTTGPDAGRCRGC
jgi:hypothetical protein